MSATPQHVLIVGAGSVGVVLGYHLNLAGVKVTFLIRPHRVKDLNHPQVLYSYNDNDLKTFSDYKYITDPEHVAANGEEYDYIVVTLDGASLRNEVGEELVRSIGKAVRGSEVKKTQVIVLAVLYDVKTWFLEVSGLTSDQVAVGTVYIHIYPAQILKLPETPSVDSKLLGQADFAYADKFGPGFVLENSASELAEKFVKLYNTCGVSSAQVVPPEEYSLFFLPLFPVFATSELLGWPDFRDIDHQSPLWSLTVAAIKELQSLDVHGEAGRAAAQATTGQEIAAKLAGFEQALLPLDMQKFNRFHHGGKVNLQDRQLLRVCLAVGEAEGKSMAALKELLQRADAHRAESSS